MNGVTALIAAYGYIVLFLGVVIEGEIFPLAAGWLSSLGDLNVFISIVVTFVGVVIGDIIWYKIGYRWGRPLLDRCGRFIWLKRSRVQALQQHFEENGKRTLFITKFIYSFGHSSIIVAGMAGMNFKEFLKVDVPAGLLWSILFVILGRFLGHSFILLSDTMKNMTLAIIIVISVLIVIHIFTRRKLGRKV
ncbi:MAG: DedA family protein [Patescibacteria group bacterium]